MRTLLRIDSSARKRGSHSRALADHYQRRWQEANPGGKVIARDLAETPIPHLQGSTIAAFLGDGDAAGPAARDGAALSDALIAELEAADQVLVSSPLYNFSAPSTLKAYIDHVVRFGRTFGAGEQGYFGLLKGKSACIVTARGGAAGAAGAEDYQGPFLTTAFELIGFERVDWIALEGTNAGDGGLEERAARARSRIDALFDASPTHARTDAKEEIQWLGAFTPQDRDEINALRAAQVRAILSGDAAAYARLCTDDVLLMLQGHDLVAGRPGFLDCETKLFRSTAFASMRQIPLRVERQGHLAVESGRQEVSTAPGSQRAASFQARRKYTHVLRRTAEGWRFAALMSNNSV